MEELLGLVLPSVPPVVAALALILLIAREVRTGMAQAHKTMLECLTKGQIPVRVSADPIRVYREPECDDCPLRREGTEETTGPVALKGG